MTDIITSALIDASHALEGLMKNESAHAAIAEAAQALVCTFQSGGRAFSCGNGGSMCDAMHFAEELSGRFRDDRPALAALAISDPGYITCVGNDYGYDRIFARYLEAHARPHDLLLAITTSGESQNVVAAATHARQQGIKVIALVGKPESTLGRLADIEICTPAGRYADRVQELHIKVIHILIELVEHALFVSATRDAG